MVEYKNKEMAGTFLTIDTGEFIKGIWTCAIKPLWWLWLLVLALGLLPRALDYFFRWLKKKISKK